MTWVDVNGDERPQSWEEYCETRRRTRCLPYWMRSGLDYYPQPRPSYSASPRLVETREKVLRMRQRLFRADPHCFWCGREVRLGVVNGNAQATVDHLYSRLHPHRETRHREQKGVLHVLACSECNNERGICEQRRVLFVPKLAHRQEFARLADATLASAVEGKILSPQVPPVRVIQTLEEAIAFAKENPAR